MGPCPDVPDQSGSGAPGVEPDLNKDHEWAEFLQHVASFGFPKKDVSWTSEEFLQRRDEFAASMPVTQYGELPHPRQMDAWLADRANQPHGSYIVARVAESDGVPLWRASAIEPSVPS